ncbi:MAG: YraN family protein [Halanaerobiales bacterium]|nr:YraN family protein [Halanaerobiales bacterium]
MKRIEVGRLGEKMARDFLLRKGYNILAENYRTSQGEIDLVTEENKTIIFVEVRTRSTRLFGSPLESITPTKRERLIRVAIQFCAQYYLYSQNFRFDVIGISLYENIPKIEHITNAFIIGRD